MARKVPQRWKDTSLVFLDISFCVRKSTSVPPKVDVYRICKVGASQLHAMVDTEYSGCSRRMYVLTPA